MADVIVNTYHSFFISSSVDGHLGCFHVLALVNIAAVNIGVHVSFSVLVSSGCMPSGRTVVLFYSSFLKDSPYCLPQWLYQFMFPLAM